MAKNYVLICVEYRQRISSSFYETYEETHKAMVDDFMKCITPEDYQIGLKKNDAPCDEDWWIKDDCAWIGDNAYDYNIEWYIVYIGD